MLAYDLKDILLIVPEAESMVKEASVLEAFPVDSKDSAVASALRIEYLTKVAGENVNYVTREKVATVINAYGLGPEIEKMASKIATFGEAEKRASLYDERETLLLQEEVLRGELGFHQDLIKVAEFAETLTSRFSTQELSYETQLYSGSLPFGADEASNALMKRAYITGDSRYNEVLDVITEFGVQNLNLDSHEKRASVAKMVVGLDKEHFYNGDFFKEAFVKQASYTIDLAGKHVAWERFSKDHVGDVLGKDVSSAMTGDYANDKAVIEALPLDEKKALGRFF